MLSWWLLSCRDDPSPPEVPFGGAISVDNGLGCGIRGDRSLDCFGDETVEPPDGAWDRVEVGGAAACALDEGSVLACWGRDNDPVVTDAPTGIAVLDLSVSTDVACAIDPDGALGCWGDAKRDLGTLPRGPLVAASVDRYLGCAVGADGALACFGPRSAEVPDIDPGPVTDVSVVGLTWCATAADGGVTCASGNPEPSAVVTALPAGLVVQPGSLDVGWAHACALDGAGEAVCWGDGLFGADPPEVADVPPGPYDAISAGTYVTCWADAGELDCVGTEG